jgi:simple sugar transport system substrate-binding protein
MVVPQLVRHIPAKRGPLFKVSAAVSAVVAVVALGGCSSGKVDTATAGSSTDNAGGKNVSIVMIGGTSSDAFFSAIKRGAEDAAKAYGSKVQFTFLGPQNYNNLGPDVAKLEETALSQNPSIVVSPNWVEESQNDGFKRIVAKGIPVILYNSGGSSAAANVGALTYIGTDEYLSGKTGGETFTKNGGKNLVCVNTVPGAANTEARCKGMKDAADAAGAKSSVLSLPSATFGNPSAVTQAIKAQLLQDSSIDGILTIGAADADSAAAAIESANATDKVKLGTFGLSTSTLDRIKAGKQDFALDLQPYLQGFLTVSSAYQYVAYGLLAPSNPNLTGPLVIDSTNVDVAIEGAKVGVR